jgi:hypothetical protein
MAKKASYRGKSAAGKGAYVVGSAEASRTGRYASAKAYSRMANAARKRRAKRG